MSSSQYLRSVDFVEAPLVSVVIPTFNRRVLLVEAVESCLKQSYPNIEIIIVDDGSTDSTEELVNLQMAGVWSQRVRYITQVNSGASAARNKGLSLAGGKYVQFLDSDDVLLDSKIQLQVEKLESTPYTSEMCSSYGRISAMRGDPPDSRSIGVQCNSPVGYMRKMTSIIHALQTSAPLWRRDYLVARPGWREDIGLGDDLEYYMRLMRDAKDVCFISSELFIVREHDGPHLSDVGKSRNQVISAFLTHKSVVATIVSAGLWDDEIQWAVFRKARTLYANLMSVGNNNDLREFEKWVISLHQQDETFTELKILVAIRRVFGRKIILLSHGFLQFLKQKISLY